MSADRNEGAKRVKIARAVLLLLLIPLAAARLEGQSASSPSHRLDDSLLSVTGGYSTSPSHGVQGVLTHDPAGSISSASHSVTVGFGHTFLPLLLPPAVAKSFNPASVGQGESSTLTITLGNPNTQAITGVAFTDIYPTTLTNAAVPSVLNTCGGTVTAAANGTSVALVDGIIPIGGCSIRLTVTNLGIGWLRNTIPAGAVQSANAPPNPVPAAAALGEAVPTLSTGFLVLLGVLLAAAGTRLLVRGA